MSNNGDVLESDGGDNSSRVSDSQRVSPEDEPARGGVDNSGSAADGKRVSSDDGCDGVEKNRSYPKEIEQLDLATTATGASSDKECGVEGGARQQTTKLDGCDQVQVGGNSRKDVTYHEGVTRLGFPTVDATDMTVANSRALIVHTEDDSNIASQIQRILLQQKICDVICDCTNINMEESNMWDLLIVVLSKAFQQSHQCRMIYMLLQDIQGDAFFAIVIDEESSDYWMRNFPPPRGRVHYTGDIMQSMNTLTYLIQGQRTKHLVDTGEDGGGRFDLPLNISNSKNVQVGPGNRMEIHYHGEVYLLQVDPGPIVTRLNVGDYVVIEGELGDKKFTFNIKVSAADQQTCGAVEEQMMEDLTLQESSTLPQLDQLFAKSESLRILKVERGCIEFVLITNDVTALQRFEEKLLSGHFFKDLNEILITDNVKRISQGVDFALTITVVNNEEDEEAEQDESKVITSCLHHPSEKVTSFCDDCEQLVCNECLTEHEKHEVLELEMAAQIADDRMRHRVESCESQQKVIGKDRRLAQSVLDRKSSIEKLQEYMVYTTESWDTTWQGARPVRAGPLWQGSRESMFDARSVYSFDSGYSSHYSSVGNLSTTSKTSRKSGLKRFGSRLKRNVSDTVARLKQSTRETRPVKPNTPSSSKTTEENVEKLLPKPKLLHTFKTHGSGGVSVMVFTNNKYIVVDWHLNNIKVKVYSKDGTFLHKLEDGQYKLRGPDCVACNDNGDVFVLDLVDKHYNVAVYGQDLKQKTVIKEPLRSVTEGVVYSLACDNNRLVMTVGDKLIVMNMDGEIQQVIDKDILGLRVFDPLGVTISPSGNIIVISTRPHCVYILDSAGTRLLHTYSPQGDIALSWPAGVCCDEGGRIIVADRGSRRPHVISTTGEHLAVIDTDRGRVPWDVTMRGPGEVSVLDRDGRVDVYKYCE